MILSGRHAGSASQAVDDALGAIYTEPTGLFHNIVAAAGLDPTRDFRGRDLRAMDFTGADLRGFDFSQSDLRGTRIRRAAHADGTTGTLEAYLDPEDREWLLRLMSSTDKQVITETTINTVTPAEFGQSVASFGSYPTAVPVDARKLTAENPFPGLTAFNVTDADFFFGREIIVQSLISEVDHNSVVVLVGPSGSGKSSIIWAGLVPRLNSLGGWRTAAIRLGPDPFRGLARALLALGELETPLDDRDLGTSNKLATALEKGQTTLEEELAYVQQKNTGQRVLLIADQFEEAFTLMDDENRCRRFIDVLMATFLKSQQDSNPDVRLIIALRADYVEVALQNSLLADAMRASNHIVGPMNRAELQAAILRPAEWAGVSFENGLVDRLLSDLEGAPYKLPTLQFLLRELWYLRKGNIITSGNYAEIGGSGGALTRRAEQVLTLWSEADLAVFRQLSLKLVGFSNGQATRQVVSLAELNDDERRLAEHLTRSGLVVINGGPSGTTAEIAHELIIHAWPRLQDLIQESREFLLWRERLRAYLETWRRYPGPETLLRGPMLHEAKHWIGERGGSFTALERDFITASISIEQSEKTRRRQSPLSKLRGAAESLMQRPK